MIKFFRSIRRKLLEHQPIGETGNRLSKYLIYAAGEIVLVMIGILLALQVNNWNESNKLKSEETLYLNRLVVDLEKDTLYYTQRIAKANLLIDKNTSFINRMYKTQNTLADFIELLDTPMWSSEYLTIQDNTYRELVSSGKLNVLSNDNVKIAIVDYYRLVESYKNAIRDFNEYSRTLMGNHVSKFPGILKNSYLKSNHMDFYTDEMIFQESFSFLNNPASTQFKSLEDVALVYINKHNDFSQKFDEIKLKAETLITKVNQQLND